MPDDKFQPVHVANPLELRAWGAHVAGGTNAS